VFRRAVRHCQLNVAAMLALGIPIHVALGQTGVPPDSAAAITREGNGHGAPACINCHGPHLLGNPALGYPRTAGQSAPYVVAQLEALASGARKNAVMLPIAKSLSPAEREALARYLSGLIVGPAPLPDTVAARADSATLRAGEALATRGRWSDTLPACDRCHGPGGVGVGTAFPPLAGQPAVYLANQLEAWQQGTRPPGPLGLMSIIAARMSKNDIAATAAYYALQPPTPPTAKRSRP
jgi:thiosulfate dehydrogenase